MSYQVNRPKEPGLNEIWRADYLQGGYFDAQGNFRVEYVQREKMERLVNAMSSLTSSQLRRFFGHCRALESSLLSQAKTWDAIKADFVKLDYFAEEALFKQKIPREFYLFIRENVKAVQSEKDFTKGFLKHFEALVGFGASKFRER